MSERRSVVGRRVVASDEERVHRWWPDDFRNETRLEASGCAVDESSVTVICAGNLLLLILEGQRSRLAGVDLPAAMQP
jgi:hypothetical protein